MIFKLKLMLISLILIALGIYGISQSQAVFLIPLLLGITICLCVILPMINRIKRDQQIIASSRQDNEALLNAPLSTPPMTSEGSSRLLVPPPLS